MTQVQESLEPSKPYRPYTSQADRKARWAAIDPDKPLSRRERVILAEYAKDLNLTAAMVRAGRGGRHPDKRAHEIQQRANVARALEAVVVEREKAAEVSVDRIVKQYSKYAFAEGTGPILHSHTLQALEMLAKWKRMTQPEQQVTIPVQFVFIGAPTEATHGNLEDAPLEPSKTVLIPPAGR